VALNAGGGQIYVSGIADTLAEGLVEYREDVNLVAVPPKSKNVRIGQF